MGITNGKKLGRQKRPARGKYNSKAKANGWDGSSKAGNKHTGVKHIHANSF